MAAAGCTLHTYPSEGRSHITTLNPKPPIKYNSFPPTSGKHYYVPAVWGSYDSPVSEYQAIHNLEHGGIVIQYGQGRLEGHDRPDRQLLPVGSGRDARRAAARSSATRSR